MNSLPLTNKVAVIAGASGGIGSAIARCFALQGASLVLISRRKAVLNNLLKEITREGAIAKAYCFDLADPAAVKSSMQAIIKEFGRVDILVNAAGVGSVGRDILTTSLKDFQTTLDVNLKTVFLMAQAVLPGMMRRRDGVIINIGSISGKNGKANQAVYCASKFALVGFSEALLEEAKWHNIRVSIICPDIVRTANRVKKISSKSKIEDLIDPQDIAQAALLCARDSKFATFKEIVVRTRRPL